MKALLTTLILICLLGAISAEWQHKKQHPMIGQRISVLTIGADNFEAMKEFYTEKLGWKPVAENKYIVFFKMNGFLFSLCKRKMLGDFIGVSSEGSGFRPSIISYNVATEQEVRDVYESLKSKGVKIIKAPTVPDFGGLFFYFEDVEGNILEVAYNNLIPLDEKLNAIDHKPIDHL